jgi:NAD-dependent deacetylase
MHHPVDDSDAVNNLGRAAAVLRQSQRVAVLTGAGVSAESGVATFRGSGGLWEGHRIEDVATPQAFAVNPQLVWRFYNLRRANLAQVRPNPGHFALAALEQRWGPERFTLLTQNVDGLHRAAGSVNVLEVHGNLARVRCTGCYKVEDRGHEPLPDMPTCACGSLLRPDIVWFNECLPENIWRNATEAVERCDCLLVVGTSAVVYPAAGLIGQASRNGARVIEVNLERTDASWGNVMGLYGPSGQILPQLVERLATGPSA